MDLNLSKFDLSHEVKFTFEMGELYPHFVMDVVPGDKVRLSSDFLVRLQPLVSPVMGRISQYIRFYYVPYRILDRNYTDMLIDPDSPLIVPSLGAALSAKGITSVSLKDNNLLRALGVSSDDGNISSTALNEISSYFFRAYYAIYNDFFINPILDTSYRDHLDKINWSDVDLLSIRRASWFGDYFTEARPSTQYGQEVDVDLDNNKTIKVSELRLSEKLQRFREKLLGIGSSYQRYLKSFHGVAPSDATLSHPLYIGGDSRPIYVQDVEQTAPDASNPVATSYGKSVTANSTESYQFDVLEHGLIIGLTYILPAVTYQAGVPRFLLKKDYYDFYNPLFAAVGMQEISGIELSASRNLCDTFGYVERYADLKYPYSRVCGDFNEELDFWHMSRDIRKEKLSASFLETYPTDRIYSVREVDFSEYKNSTNFNYSFRSDPDSNALISHFFSVSDALLFSDKPSDDIFLYSEIWGPYENTPFIHFTTSDKLSSYPEQAHLVISLSDFLKSDLVKLNPLYSSAFTFYKFSAIQDKVSYDFPCDDTFQNWDSSGLNSTTFQISALSLQEVLRKLLGVQERTPIIHNHVLVACRNNVDALRPIPKLTNPTML